MSRTLKLRLMRLEAPLTAIVHLCQARWLEKLPEEEQPAGIVTILCGGDMDALKRNVPGLRDLSDEQIAEHLRNRAPAFIQQMRRQAREVRGMRR